MRTKAEEQYIAKDYWERRLTENWGLQGVGHISFGLPYNQWLYRVRRQVFRRHLGTLGLNCRTAKVLDIGSGTGFWLGLWKSVGVRSLTGTDITAVAVERLKVAYPGIEIIQLDIAEKSERFRSEDKFDLISAFDVLFHITDDCRFQKAIENVSRMLIPGGYFLFSDNFVHGKAARANHQVSRSLRQIEDAVTARGMRILRRVPMFVLMNAPIDTSAKWPKFLWRAAMAPVHFVPALGFVYGALLFPLELTLTRLLGESPSTEMMICQKT